MTHTFVSLAGLMTGPAPSPPRATVEAPGWDVHGKMHSQGG
ncbi:MAG: hypothetical protein ACKVIQ_09135 [Acidimicrobiales bacterium]